MAQLEIGADSLAMPQFLVGNWSTETLLSMLLLRPDRLVEPDAWVGHIPFAFWSVAALKPRVLVEFGTHSANSHAACCLAVAHLRTRYDLLCSG